MAFLEEDLAVGLMLKLIFTPLFHDRTLAGRFLSFIFRVTRIVWGLFAYLAATIVIFGLTFVWFAHPLIIMGWPEYWYVSLGILLFSIALFIDRVVVYPKRPLRHAQNLSQIWETTKLHKSDITWAKLTPMFEVKLLLESLELNPTQFGNLEIPFDDQLVLRATELARQCKAQYLTAVYFWVAMVERVPNLDNELLKVNLKIDDFHQALNFFEHKRNTWRRIYIWDEDFSVRHLKGTNRGWLAAPTPALDAASVDLTKEAARFGVPDFIGRKEVLDQVINVLSSDGNHNLVLVGPVGTGKTALVKYLAKMIVQGNAPKSMATKRLVFLEPARLMSGANNEGELAEKIKNVFDEISFIEDVIIFIDEIHTLGTGEAGSTYNLFSLLAPELESQNFQFLGTTEPENYNRTIEKNGSFARIFTRVDIPPASPEETIEILQNRAIDMERYQKTKVTFLAIKEVVHLASRFIHERVLPDSAISVLEDCQTLVKSQTDKQINLKLVRQVLGQRVKVPVAEINPDQKKQLLNLEDQIHAKFIDQEEAVKDVSTVLRRSAAQLRETNRPIGSFLFVGPTGVGKTELAKTLSEVYFKGRDTFVRFDMSEYQNADSVNRLLGTDTEPGQLTEIIYHQPYCLLLLDEFEKAHPQILTLFLQVLDDGRLTDGGGKTVDFSNTIIIATSNAASVTIAEGLKAKKPLTEIKATVTEELLKIYRPELVNRFDEVVIFKPLSPEDLDKVVTIKLASLKANLKEQGYLVDFAPALVAELGKRGFDPVLGARPLRRLIQDTLEARLSVMILEDKLPKGQPTEIGVEVLT